MALVVSVRRDNERLSSRKSCAEAEDKADLRAGGARATRERAASIVEKLLEKRIRNSRFVKA